MKTVAVCVARMGSTRLPGKVMKDLGGKPLLRWTIDAARACPLIDEVILATTVLHEDDVIANYADEHTILSWRGSEDDVLERLYGAATDAKAELVLRFTCDCPFLDPQIIGEVIKLREMTGADFASNCYPPTYPDGLDTECFTYAALEQSHREAISPVDRNCLTQFMVRNRSRYKVVNLTCPLPGMQDNHWVCDTADDFRFCQEVIKRLGSLPPNYINILSVLDKEPELREINKKSIRNERFYESLGQERLSPRTFERSKRVFERASKVIPTGANTFSKSHLQFPREGSPLYASHGDGAYIFDVDGNRYVDLVNALLPNILGYCDPDVDLAIRQQLDNGIVLSLGTELEAELAETLCRLIPCAEMVKFGKTGTDVTTAAVRLARAYTGRDYILSSGYHGWADWSMAITNRHSGIPEDVKDLTINLDSKERLIKWVEGEWLVLHPVAAVIVEPTDDPEYLQWLRDYCTKHGVVLIFDEIRTGFRYDLGGAQALYGVTPDLACFGKAMANGMPISALVGKREIMKLMETPDVYYSGTFFGETLSIAAAIATIKKMESENVIDYLCKVGARLEREILGFLRELNLNDYIGIDGWYPCQHLIFKGDFKDNTRTLFMQEMFQNGVLIIASNNLSYAIKEPEFKRISSAYWNTFVEIGRAISSGSIKDIKPTEAAPLRMVP